MKEVLKFIAPQMRELGFKGSGQTFRKTDGDFIFLVNFQSSHTGDCFYVNLGAQPVFIPPEGNADFKSLKEYECVLRRRVGKEWLWSMSASEMTDLVAEIALASGEFFGQAQTLRQSLAQDNLDELLRKFSSGTTIARATLHLARGALNLGLPVVANTIANHGLSLAEEGATILIADLRKVIEASTR